MTEWEQQQAMVAAALEAFGQLDVVFANAGFGATRGFLEESPEHWRAMVLTNVYGAALTIRATIPALRESRGHLLLTGSVAGRVALPGSLYSCTKWAVTAMAQAARQELDDNSGVRVTLIEPGMVATPFFENDVSAVGAAGRRHRRRGHVRRQPPEDGRRERHHGAADPAAGVAGRAGGGAQRNDAERSLLGFAGHAADRRASASRVTPGRERRVCRRGR